jgi:hypothetical protein
LGARQAQIVLKEVHERVVRRHFVIDIIAKKILNARCWWQPLFKDTLDFCKIYTNYQKIKGFKTKSLAKLVTKLLKEP